MAYETEGKTIQVDTITEGIRNLILQPNLGTYYVCEEITQDDAGNEVRTPVGCTMITYELSARLGGLIYMIQSVFVKKEYRKLGVFRRLYNHVISKAKEDELCTAVRLYVEQDNKVAQAVYEKVGMTKMTEWDFDEKDLVFSH